MAKYRVWFSRNVGGVDTLIGNRMYDPTNKKQGCSFKGKTFLIDLSDPIYSSKNILVYLIDFDSAQQISTYARDGSGVDPKLIEAHFTKETARQLASRLGTSTSGNWKLALVIGLMAAGMSIPLGIIIQAAFHLIG